MSIPRKHHYLPEFFLRRWAIEDKIWRFERHTRAPGKPLHARRVSPAAAANQSDLYANPLVEDAAQKQSIESQFFQKIDDRGAKAITLLDQSQPLDLEDRGGLTQFVVSLLHRSPSRIQWMRDHLKINMEAGWEDSLGLQEAIDATALETLTTVIGSGPVLETVANFDHHIIDLANSKTELLLTDRPVTLSNGILHDSGFLMIPLSPRQLLILTANYNVAKAFQAQFPTKLARAVNEAIVVQAQHVVISTFRSQEVFIKRNFLVEGNERHNAINPIDGLMRWQVP